MKEIVSSNYSIFFNNDGYLKLQELIYKLKYSNVFVLVDENTEVKCLKVLLSKLNQKFSVIKIKSGEENKNLSTCNYVWSFLNNSKADRKSLLINLGGGVITDMGGFIASTFKRGIDFVNIPTTLLSIIDASIGSKTGVNFNQLKNNIGTFTDPKLVIIDKKYLETLDEKNLKSGYAEIFKHSLISGKLFVKLLNDPKTIYNHEIIYNSINVKNNIVLRDREESNLRKSLNFGHTIGHAYESLKMKKKDKLLHGEAIAAGMIIELYLSHIVLNFPKKTVNECNKHLGLFFKKIKTTDLEIDQLFRLMEFDKKNYKNEINFVLLNEVGSFKTDVNVSREKITEAIKYYQNN